MMKRVLILAHADDSGAMQVAKAIDSQVGRQLVEILQPEILALTQWSHHIDPHGRATTRLRLPNRRELITESLGCLFDRVRYLPNIPFAHAAPKNRDYAVAELHALVISWIAELGRRAVNPLSIATGIISPISQRKWLNVAHNCGLPVARYVAATAGSLADKLLPGERLQPGADWPGGSGSIPVEVLVDDATVVPSGSVLVCGDRVFGSLAQVFGVCCLKLATEMQCKLLEIQFGSIDGRLLVVEVSPYPLLDSPWAVDATAQLILDLALDRGGSI